MSYILTKNVILYNVKLHLLYLYLSMLKTRMNFIL